MSQSFWETEVGEEVQPEQQVAEPQAEMQQMPEQQTQPEEPHHEPVAEREPAAEPVADSGALAVSGDEFSALEERILRTVSMLKRERSARAEAEERAAKAEAQLHEQAPLMEHFEKELNVLRAERDHVRQRVERLLSQLDALEL
jgi:septal ring factor EnvC (AmiA/AmiB activator)